MSISVEQQILIEQRVTNDAKSPLVAYLLLIFLGGLGAHRFYLGRPISAIVILVLMVLGGLTIGLAIGIPMVIVGGCWLILDLFLIPGMVRADKESLRARLTSAGIASSQAQ